MLVALWASVGVYLPERDSLSEPTSLKKAAAVISHFHQALSLVSKKLISWIFLYLPELELRDSFLSLMI